jgi:hypothetical protein
LTLGRPSGANNSRPEVDIDAASPRTSWEDRVGVVFMRVHSDCTHHRRGWRDAPAIAKPLRDEAGPIGCASVTPFALRCRVRKTASTVEFASMPDEQPQQRRRVLPAVALGSAVVGAICAVGLTTYAGARVGSPLVLRLLFALWVFSPFAAILTGHAISESWRPAAARGVTSCRLEQVSANCMMKSRRQIIYGGGAPGR